MKKHFDLIIVGCGPGGYKSAIIAAQAGYRVAIIEKCHAGGTCLNQGCIPKEILTRLAKLSDEVKAFNGLGLDGDVSLNFADAIKHKNKVIENISKTIRPWLKQLGIHFFEGNASFVNNNTIQIDCCGNETQIIGDRIIIATGSKAKEHPTIPFRSPDIINSKEFMFQVNKLPKRVLFIGGGSIGTELGFVLRQFGSEVTISETGDQLLNHPSIPDRAINALEKKLKQLGIKIKKNTRAITEITSETSINVLFSDGTAEGFDMVIVSIGREPNTDELNLENAGIKTDENGFIITDKYLETSCKGVYAIGDVKPGPMTANIAFHDAKIATANALGGNHKQCDYQRVPIVIDSALQIAAVGYTEEGAEDAGFEPEVIRTNLAGSTIGQLSHTSQGFMDVVHDEETNAVLGGCVVGPQAREMIQTVVAASQSDQGLGFFTDLHYAHPSWNEEFENTVSRYVKEFTGQKSFVEKTINNKTEVASEEDQ